MRFLSKLRVSCAHSFYENKLEKFRSLRARRSATFALFHLLHSFCHFLFLNLPSSLCFSSPFAFSPPQLAPPFGSRQRMATKKGHPLRRQACNVSDQGGARKGEREEGEKEESEERERKGRNSKRKTERKRGRKRARLRVKVRGGV